jgi:hypothetical protein
MALSKTKAFHAQLEKRLAPLNTLSLSMLEPDTLKKLAEEDKDRLTELHHRLHLMNQVCDLLNKGYQLRRALLLICEGLEIDYSQLQTILDYEAPEGHGTHDLLHG